MVLPAEFIPTLEESGLIVEVGAWVLREACRQIAPLGDLRVAVNISSRQFQADDLEGLVREALSDGGLPAGRLEVELTESMVMRNPQRAACLLKRLRALGVRVALDDFGTGSSSLSTLRKLPLDVPKVDRTFVREVHLNREDRTIIATIGLLARGLELTTVAEGAENEVQAHAALEVGIDHAQGWHYGQAMPVDRLQRWQEERASGVGH